MSTQTVTFIHPFIQYILGTYYVPGPVVGTGANTVNKNKVPFSWCLLFTVCVFGGGEVRYVIVKN